MFCMAFLAVGSSDGVGAKDMIPYGESAKQHHRHGMGL